MKKHIIIKLNAQHPEVALPHWQDILGDHSSGTHRFLPEIDTIIERFGLQVLATREHAPHGRQWSEAERDSGLNRLYRLILKRDMPIPEEMIRQISVLPVVERVHAGRIGLAPLPSPRVQSIGNRTDSASRQIIYLPQAHAITEGDPDIIIAVLDTGVDVDHVELQGQMLPGYDFVNILENAKHFIGDHTGSDPDPDDEVGHGVHVAGIIGAKGVNMPKGVAPGCRILPVRVLAAMMQGGRRVGAGLVENIDAGIKWAVDQGAHIINMSLGVRHDSGGLPHQEVVDYAERKGVIMVAAAGNDGEMRPYYPGAFKSVLAVGAMDPGGEVAAFSTYGPQVSFVAPGTNIYSSYLNNGYAFSSGTSQATPFVSGTVALILSAARAMGHKLSGSQVRHILKHTADKVGPRFKDRKAGFGRLNAWDALKLVRYKLAA